MGALSLRFEHFASVIRVNSAKEESIETKVVEQGSIGLSMAEGINVPADSWLDSELVLEPSMALLKVTYNVFVVGIAFISSNPTAHGDFETAIFNKVLDVLLHLFGLSGVPHIEILHFNVSEYFGRVLEKLKDDCIEYSLDPLCDLNSSLLACEVVIVGFEPPHVIMSVRHHVHCQFYLGVYSRKNFYFWHFHVFLS